MAHSFCSTQYFQSLYLFSGNIKEIYKNVVVIREKPKVIKAAEKKNTRSDGEPGAKRQKIDVNETTVVQEVIIYTQQQIITISDVSMQ